MTEQEERERYRYLQLKRKAMAAQSVAPEAKARKSGPFDITAPPAAIPAPPAEAGAAPSGPFGGGEFSGEAGASGGWGYPDPGFVGAMRAKFGQGVFKDGFDESMGALTAFQQNAAPGAYLRMPDGTEVPASTGPDMYRAGRDFVRQEQQAADQHWPKLGFLAQMGGETLGDYALAGPKALGRGYQTLAGLVRGLNMSDAELTPDKATPWTAGEAALSSLFGGAVGNQAPVLMSKAANSGLGRYLGSKADDALTYSGDKLKSLGGWFKVNSLHPTPTNAEAMAALPGGTIGVGRELLERKAGGLTKGGTARDISREFRKANAATTELATYHDAVGAPPVDIRGALAAGRARAQEMIDEPTTKAAGRRMMDLVEDYEAKYASGAAPAEAILGMKRALGKTAYGAKDQLNRSGDTIAGDFGEGVSVFERSVDDALDAALGPRFEAANLLSRRLRGADQAADRTAARAQGNQLVSLKNWVAANAIPGLAGGAAGGLFGDSKWAALGGMALGGKYGSQVAARTLFNGGRLLQSLPRVARFAAQHASPSPVAQEMMASPRGSTLADLLDLIRQRQPMPMPAYAQGDDQ